MNLVTERNVLSQRGELLIRQIESATLLGALQTT